MIKRAFDLTFAIIGLISLFPLMLIIALLIKFEDDGPIFYLGKRIGQFSKPFLMYKFRTMIVDADKVGGPSTALNDPRLTRIGKFLRKYKLDELPQLINIIKGEMSFVGPRPQVERYTMKYKGEEKTILSVKPGITDYASIRFIDLDRILGDENVDEKYLKEIEPEKNRFRIKYIKEKSFWVDLKIILLTLLTTFKTHFKWNINN